MPQLATHPIHLGLGASASAEPAFTGMEWYAAYTERHASDGHEGRLVSLYEFSASWDHWEMHPGGEEVVVCLDGAATLWQETSEGVVTRLELGRGDYAINPRGVWHTADVSAPVRMLFITSGIGTQHRPR